MKALIAWTVASIFLLPAAVAQQDPGVATISVIATDARGHRATALTTDDVQLFQDQQPIEVVSVAGSRAARPRRIVIMFDVRSLSLGARRGMIEALDGFLTRSLRPGDAVMVLTVGQKLRPMSSWSSDRGQIAAALERAGGEMSSGLAGDRVAAEERMYEMINDIRQTESYYTFSTLVEAARSYAAAVYRDTVQTVTAMSAAVSLFSPLATRNVLLIVGGGLPLRPGADLFQYLDAIRTQAEQGQLGANLRKGASSSSPLSEGVSYDLTPEIRAFGESAWIHGVTIYPIDSDLNDTGAGRVDRTRSSDRAAAFTTVANQSAGYKLLAEETGGRTQSGGDPKGALSEIGTDLESFFTISFRPRAPIAGRTSIQVRSKGGYKVRFTRGGAAVGDADAEMRDRVVANQLMKPEINDLGIAVEAAAPVVDGQKRRVSVKVLIPIKKLKLVEQGGLVTGSFSVYLATGDPSGHSSEVNKQTQQIRWPPEALQNAGDKRLTFALEVVLEPGRTQISVGVLDHGSGMAGYDRVSI